MESYLFCSSRTPVRGGYHLIVLISCTPPGESSHTLRGRRTSLQTQSYLKSAGMAPPESENLK